MEQDLLYQIALTHIPQVGNICARVLTDHFADARSIFSASVEQLCLLDGVGEIRARAIHQFNGWAAIEEEIRFIDTYHIHPLFIGAPAYPQRLLNCADAPVILYQQGETVLNVPRVIAVVGTRNPTEYGRLLTEKLIADLADMQVLVVSGLAYGIDALAHKAALHYGLSTIGVLAHGLDQLYPPRHRSLAAEMVRHGGGLLTEFCSHTQPDRHNFPIRNRIVAGMADAVVVVETGLTGGSLITAELANGYNRDVFAFPGRTNDAKSMGCNELIRNNKSLLINAAADLIQAMNWEGPLVSKPARQAHILNHLSDQEKALLHLLEQKGPLSLDELHWHSQLGGSQVAAALLSLELQNLVELLPGKQYRII